MLVDLNTLKTVSNGFLQKINENSNDFLQKINEKADKKEIVQSDWSQNNKNATNYINNRTHWEEKKITEILPLTTLEFTSAGWEGGQSINSLSVVEGETYIVKWDGQEYPCICFSFSGLVLGNVSMLGATDTGEPFLIFTSGSAFSSTIGTHTIAIYKEEDITIHQLDPKYIKDMYYDNGTIITEVLPETTIEGFINAWDSTYLVENVIEMTPKVGMIYAVNWDGTEYITECKNSYDGVYIGNPNYSEGLSDGDIPFIIDFYPDGGDCVRVESPEFSHTISITEVNNDLKQLDIKYLPIIEKTSEIMFEMNDIAGGGVFDTPTDKILIGKHLVTINGVSETLNFVLEEGNQSSSAQHSLGFIQSFYRDGKYGIYLYFTSDITHSVKIEKINNFIKEENLPNSIARRPDWNQNDEAASDFIKNKPFYKEENIEELIFEGEINFDEDGYYYFDPQIELKSGTKYTIVFNGLAYEEESYFDDTDLQNMINVATASGGSLYISSKTLQIYNQKVNAPCYFKIFIGSLHVAKKIDPMFILEDDRKMSAWDPYGSGSFSMNIRYNAKIGNLSHAEGSECEASGSTSHAEGSHTTASGNSSHAEGEDTEALGNYSHAEGLNNLAVSRSQNVIGEYNISEDVYLSSETKIIGSARICAYSERDNIYFCDGYTFDKNSGLYELVPIEYESIMNGSANLWLKKNIYMIYGGKTGTVMYYGDPYSDGTGSRDTVRVYGGNGIEYRSVNNTITRGKYAHIVGNGTYSTRSNAHTLDWNGVGWFQGGLQVGGIAQDGDGVGYVPAIPAGASIGQTIMVKAVDENGKPTEWEAVDPWMITSSTEGSTKKFKLAVDDSGTITATEVT